MIDNATRPVRRPQPASATPTLVRVSQNTSLFRGWGVTL
jgi:hypothetical protein